MRRTITHAINTRLNAVPPEETQIYNKHLSKYLQSIFKPKNVPCLLLYRNYHVSAHLATVTPVV